MLAVGLKRIRNRMAARDGILQRSAGLLLDVGRLCGGCAVVGSGSLVGYKQV